VLVLSFKFNESSIIKHLLYYMYANFFRYLWERNYLVGNEKAILKANLLSESHYIVVYCTVNIFHTPPPSANKIWGTYRNNPVHLSKGNSSLMDEPVLMKLYTVVYDLRMCKTEDYLGLRELISCEGWRRSFCDLTHSSSCLLSEAYTSCLLPFDSQF